MGIPFDESAITLIMGLCPDDEMEPCEKGGPMHAEDDGAKKILMKIKKILDDYLGECKEPDTEMECDEDVI